MQNLKLTRNGSKDTNVAQNPENDEYVNCTPVDERFLRNKRRDCIYLLVNVGSDLFDLWRFEPVEKLFRVGQVEKVDLQMGGDGRVLPYLSKLGMVAENQSVEDDVLDEGIEHHVQNAHEPTQTHQYQQT